VSWLWGLVYGANFIFSRPGAGLTVIQASRVRHSNPGAPCLFPHIFFRTLHGRNMEKLTDNKQNSKRRVISGDNEKPKTGTRKKLISEISRSPFWTERTWNRLVQGYSKAFRHQDIKPSLHPCIFARISTYHFLVGFSHLFYAVSPFVHIWTLWRKPFFIHVSRSGAVLNFFFQFPFFLSHSSYEITQLSILTSVSI